MGVNTQRTDGKSIQLVAPADVVGGEPVYINGWFGIAETDADDGDLVAVAVDDSVYELDLAAGTPAVGDIVYIHGDTNSGNVALNTTAASGIAFAKVVEVDGTDGTIVLGKLLDNRPDAVV